MDKNIEQTKSILNRKFSGANIDDVQGIGDFTVFEEAANSLLSRLDPQETVRTTEINLYDGIYDYTAPSDLKGQKILDIRPQAHRTTGEEFWQTYTETFDRDKSINDGWFSVEFDEGTKFLRITKSVSNSITITTVDKGDYTAGTGASNVDEDTILHFGAGKSVVFDVSSGTNLLTWQGTSVDLTDHELKAGLFLPIFIPDSSIINSIKLRVGSSSSDYYEITGQIHFGSLRDGHNIYRFDWDGTTETGSVTIDEIDYLRIDIDTSSADTDIRIGKIDSKLPKAFEILYYSDSLFRDADGNFENIPSDTDSTVNLDHDAFNIFLYECCTIISEDMQREGLQQKFYARLGVDPATNALTGGGLYGQYLADNPEESIRPQNKYYDTPRPAPSDRFRTS